jgi:hypothetical protein
MTSCKANRAVATILLALMLPACSTGSYFVPKREMDRVRAATADERERMVVPAERQSDGEGVDLRARAIDQATVSATRSPEMVAVKATAVSNLTIAGIAVGASGLVPFGFGIYFRETCCEPGNDVAESVGKSVGGGLLILVGAGVTLAGLVMVSVGTTQKPQEVSSRGAATAYSPTIVLAPGGVGFRAPLW